MSDYIYTIVMSLNNGKTFQSWATTDMAECIKIVDECRSAVSRHPLTGRVITRRISKFEEDGWVRNKGKTMFALYPDIAKNHPTGAFMADGGGEYIEFKSDADRDEFFRRMREKGYPPSLMKYGTIVSETLEPDPPGHTTDDSDEYVVRPEFQTFEGDKS